MPRKARLSFPFPEKNLTINVMKRYGMSVELLNDTYIVVWPAQVYKTENKMTVNHIFILRKKDESRYAANMKDFMYCSLTQNRKKYNWEILNDLTTIMTLKKIPRSLLKLNIVLVNYGKLTEMLPCYPLIFFDILKKRKRKLHTKKANPKKYKTVDIVKEYQGWVIVSEIGVPLSRKFENVASLRARLMQNFLIERTSSHVRRYLRSKLQLMKE
jgi:hypothetical protein